MSNKQKTIEGLIEAALVPEDEQPYEVPENWVWVRLGSVVNFFSGSAFPNQFQGHKHFDIPFYKVGSLKDIDSDYYLYNEDNTISEEMRIQLKAKLVPKDTILFAKIGEAIRLNRRSLVSKPACIDNNLMGFRGKEKLLENKFLLLWSLKEGFYKYSQASAVPSIRKSTLENIALPLPTLKEQKRIAENVERLLSKIEEAKQLIEEAKKTFELRRAAILDKAFRGELTRKWRKENPGKILVLPDQITPVGLNNKKATSLVPEASIPDTWKWVLSNELFSFVTSGSRGWAKYYSDDGDLFLRVGNLNHESIDIDLTNQQYVSPPEGTEGTRTLVQEGDILVSITADVGRIAVVPKQFPKAYINQHIALARPSSGYCVEYVAWFLSSRNGGRLQFDRLQRGATKAGLGLNDIKSVWVPVPSLEEQYEIVHKIQSAFYKFEVAEKSLTNTLEVYEELKKSILGKAFRGELGTNDPSEENAIELFIEVLQEQVGTF